VEVVEVEVVVVALLQVVPDNHVTHQTQMRVNNAWQDWE
jgi:hypothetical protein